MHMNNDDVSSCSIWWCQTELSADSNPFSPCCDRALSDSNSQDRHHRELSTTLYYCSKQCHCYSIACCLVDCQCSADGSVVVTATDAGIVSIFVTPSLSDSHLASVFISADAAGSSLVSAMSVFCASFTSLNATATQATSIHAAGTLARHAL